MRDNKEIAKRRVVRTHSWVEFGKGKSINKCHKCGAVRKKITLDGIRATYYEKNGETLKISPECDTVNF